MANLITGYTVETNTPNGYLAPELLYVILCDGDVETRGALLQTGWIVSITGTVVQTLSGSTYRLGTPAKGTAEDAAASIRAAMDRFQDGEVSGYHPGTLRHILALAN